MKRILYILAVIVVSILLVTGMLLAALTSDKVETAAVRLATAEFARALGTNAQVSAVEYRFPARLALRDIYVEDRQRDTLAYIGEIYAHFSPLALRHGEIRFSHARLTDVVVNAYQTPDSVWNYQFLLDAFRQPQQEESQPFRSLLSVRDIRLENIRIRYQDYHALLSRASLDLHHFSADSLDAQITDLAATVRRSPASVYRKPLEIESLKARVVLTDSLITLPTLTARLPNSRLDLSGIRIEGKPVDASTVVSLVFHEAEIVPADLALLVPDFKRLYNPVTLNGAVGGTVDSIYFNDITLRYNNRVVLEGSLSAVGLPDLQHSYVRANLKEMNTTAARLQDFLSALYGRPVRLPREVHRLGTIHYRGLAEGRLQDMTLHGAFRTALGTISTDGSFRSDSLFEHMSYDARVVGRRFRLGKLLSHPPLTTATLEVNAKGQIDSGQVNGNIKAHVRALTYNGYTFSDLNINGHHQPKQYKGHFDINDPHLTMAFDGVVNLQDQNPEINFLLRCPHFDASPLDMLPSSVSTKESPLTTRFALSVNLTGTDIDRMNGSLVIDTLFLATAQDSVMTQQLTLSVQANNKYAKTITLTSDYLNAETDGVFRYQDLAPAFQAMLHHYLPSAVPAPKQRWQPVQFSVRADGQRLRDVQRLYLAPFTLSDHPSLRAETRLAQGAEPKLDFRFFAPGVRAGNTPVHDLTVTLNTIDTLRHAAGEGSGLSLSVSAEALQMQTVLSTLAFHDTLMTHVTLRRQSQIEQFLPEGWRALSPRELQRALSPELTFGERHQALLAAQRAGDYGGDLRCITHFSRYAKKPLIDIHVMPGTLLLRDSVYTIGDSRITYCAADTSVQIDRFIFEGGGQHIRANGLASSRMSDTLEVDLRNIDASYVVPFLLPVQTIMFDGLLTGQAHIASVFKKPQIETSIHIDSMGLNNCYFGDAEVSLFISDSLAFHADVNRPTRKVVNLDGKALFDGSGVWELDMITDSVPLEFVNHWTSSVLKNLDGTASGHVVVGGKKGLTYVLLNAQAQEASFTLPWTGARYTIPADTIVMDTSAIRFPHVRLRDAEGNALEIDGAVTHEQFHDFAMDLHVDAHKALVFDSEEEGQMLQGHVYATGHVDVTGTEQDILVAADAHTTRSSRFRLSIDNVSSASESNFIHFVNHNDTIDSLHIRPETDLDNIDNPTVPKEKNSTPTYARASRALLKLNLEVNPQLLFMLVLGERNGDMIQARGNGALQLTYDTRTNDVHLLGTYDIDHGTLSYTVANVIRKEFTVGEGSTIVFSGDPTNPQLDVTAKYRVTANLRDLFGDEANQLATSRSNIPVLTCLHLSGLLQNPTLTFSLEFPMSDQSIQQQVRQIINTDEMLMRQVIYLLVFGRFFTPDYMAVSQYATLNSTYSLLSSTVTSQINAWLSKLTNMLTLGVAIRTEGEGANAGQEYEAQFQLQPVDRLIINGNVGYRYNDISNQPFFGDLDVEVLLTEDGQWRLKGYTHTVDKYSLRQAATIQGVGFVWKKDF